MVRDHRKDVAESKKQADKNKDPQLKPSTPQKLPALQEHLRMAQQLEGQVKAAKAGSLNR